MIKDKLPISHMFGIRLCSEKYAMVCISLIRINSLLGEQAYGTLATHTMKRDVNGRVEWQQERLLRRGQDMRLHLKGRSLFVVGGSSGEPCIG